ncbi:hypothetical protein ACI75Y_09585 [Capnocytophaga stomatis]|uniref:hypothetical protein n=1 Tax=Capnocytophaga stomatis TaxID=1848904 RepID=UPI00385B752C
MRNWLKKVIIDGSFDKSNYILGVLGGIFSLIDISNFDDWCIGENKFPVGKILYYLFVVLFFIFCAISFSYGKEIDKIEKENDRLKQENDTKSLKIKDLESKINEVISDSNELFNSYLKLLTKNLDFTHTERISVYKVDNSLFKLIGRTSEDPTLMEKGRDCYPINEGFISVGWKKGECFVDNLPCPIQKFTDYYKEVNKLSPIQKEVVSTMKMKSRNFFIYRINGYNGKAKALLVFESTLPNKFKKEFIIDKLKGIKQPLITFIEKNNGVVSIENNLGI